MQIILYHAGIGDPLQLLYLHYDLHLPCAVFLRPAYRRKGKRKILPALRMVFPAGGRHGGGAAPAGIKRPFLYGIQQFHVPEENDFLLFRFGYARKACYERTRRNGAGSLAESLLRRSGIFPAAALCAEKEVPLKEKLPKLFLLFFLLLSFSTNTLNFIWHGMNYPDSLPCRQSFLYIILLLTVCFEGLSGIEKYSRRTLWFCSFGVLSFLLLCQKLIDTEMFTHSVFLATLFMLLAYMLLIFYYHYGMNPENGVSPYLTRKPKILCLTLILCMLEAGLNTFITSVPTVNRTNYLKSYDDYYTLMDKTAKSDGGFYRVEKFRRVTKNDGMLLSYPSASLFSSTSNAHVKDFYGKYGLQNSKVYYNYEGSTPLTAALLNVKYMISKEELEPGSLYHLANREGDLYLYRNSYALPFGFFIDTQTEGNPKIQFWHWKSYSAVSKIWRRRSKTKTKTRSRKNLYLL